MPTGNYISILFRYPSRRIHRRPLREFLNQAARLVIPGRGVACLITDDRELRALNRRFLRKDYATDVLSFPAPKELARTTERASNTARSAEACGDSRRLKGPAGPVRASKELARTTEPDSAGSFRVPGSLNGRAGPVRASKELARTTERSSNQARSAGSSRVPGSLKGRAGPVRASNGTAGGNGEPGEMAISLDRAAAQAAALGHSVEEELRILMLHGLLHLAGMDHEADTGQMARAEARLRKRLQLPPGLMERAGA